MRGDEVAGDEAAQGTAGTRDQHGAGDRRERGFGRDRGANQPGDEDLARADGELRLVQTREGRQVLRRAVGVDQD
ncbi:hypothetical protein, partial [Streptomyces sp. UH6]|uniref:hypothetical protein n=1 Tax=Streptomyces sp. UH6 TaxID=2748379 RepID=UPI00280C2911